MNTHSHILTRTGLRFMGGATALMTGLHQQTGLNLVTSQSHFRFLWQHHTTAGFSSCSHHLGEWLRGKHVSNACAGLGPRMASVSVGEQPYMLCLFFFGGQVQSVLRGAAPPVYFYVYICHSQKRNDQIKFSSLLSTRETLQREGKAAVYCFSWTI